MLLELFAEPKAAPPPSRPRLFEDILQFRVPIFLLLVMLLLGSLALLRLAPVSPNVKASVRPVGSTTVGSATAFFAQVAETVRQDSLEAQAALESYRQANPMVLSKEAADVAAQIGALERQSRATDEEIDATLQAILGDERRLHELPDEGNGPHALSVTQLGALLTIYEDERNVLRTLIPRNSYTLVALERKIEATREAQRAAQESPVWKPGALSQLVVDQLAEANAELKTLEAARASQAAQLALLRGSSASLQPPNPDLLMLQLKAEALYPEAQAATRRYREAQIADAIGGPQPFVAALPVAAPVRPVANERRRLMITAGALGVLLLLSVASFFFERLDVESEAGRAEAAWRGEISLPLAAPAEEQQSFPFALPENTFSTVPSFFASQAETPISVRPGLQVAIQIAAIEQALEADALLQFAPAEEHAQQTV